MCFSDGLQRHMITNANCPNATQSNIKQTSLNLDESKVVPKNEMTGSNDNEPSNTCPVHSCSMIIKKNEEDDGNVTEKTPWETLCQKFD